MSKRLWSSVFLLAGTTIGAGLFAIPYATVQAGYLAGLFWLVVLSIVILLVNLIYAQVIIGTKDKDEKQFIGYSVYYLGTVGKVISTIIVLFGLWGTNLAYIIGLGSFLAVIFNSSDMFIFSTVAFVVVSIGAWFRIRFVAAMESWLTIGMISIIGLIIYSGFEHISYSNLFTEVSLLSLDPFLLTYGVFMSALTGYSILPEMSEAVKEVSDGDQDYKKNFYKAIALGTLIPAVVYILFQGVVVGISGEATSEEAIQGLVPFLDVGVVKFGALFGLMAMLSSYLTLTVVLKDTFMDDFNFPKFRSWFIAVLPPYILFAIGLNSFIQVLELTGATLGTTSMLMIVLMLVKQKRTR